MPSTCTFAFDRKYPVYYSGETINGHITLRTTKEKIVRGVYIIFEGVAKVLWKESSIDSDTSLDVEYSAHETYLNKQTRVFGDGTLPVGTYEYAFKIPLPLECPTSCTEKHGKVSYKILLKLDRPLRFDNVFTKPVIVMEQLNLNCNRMYAIPLKAEDIINPCFCLFPSGPVISTLTLPFGGWAPGQKINFKLKIDNRSRSPHSARIKLKLVQTYSFTAHRPHHKTYTHKKTLAQFEQGDLNVLLLSKFNVYGKLRIPEVPPTSMNGTIIKVSYQIEMNISMGVCQRNSKTLIPITIGTIPLIATVKSANENIYRQLEE